MRVAQVAQHAMFSAARGRGSRGLWRRALRSGTAGGAQPRVRVVREHVHDGNSGATGARDRGRARGGRPGAVPGRCASSARRPGLRGVGGGPGSLRAGCAGPTGWEACRGASAVGGLRRAGGGGGVRVGDVGFLETRRNRPLRLRPGTGTILWHRTERRFFDRLPPGNMVAWLSGRASPSHGGGHRFKSCSDHHETAGQKSFASDLFLCQRHFCAGAAPAIGAGPPSRRPASPRPALASPLPPACVRASPFRAERNP